MLDIRTVMVLLILATAIAACGLALVRHYYLRVPGVGHWVIGNALVALAQGLALARDVLPALVSIVLGHGLTIVAVVVMLAGFQRFTETRMTVLTPGLVVAGGVTLLLAWFTFVVPAPSGRAVTIAATLAGFNLLVGLVLWPGRGAAEPARRVCAVVYFLSVLFFLRCAWVWFDQPPVGPFQGGNLVALVYLFAFVKTLLNSFLQLILVSERLNAELRRQAECDPLTGALNRRAFTLVAAKAMALAERTGQPLTLLMLDLDHFKRANDSRGHAFGDALLCDFVRLAGETLRAQDAFCRHGGEEFLALLPDTDAAQALAVAERLRRAYAALAPARAVAGTVSIGLAGLRPGDDLDGLIRRADQALYQAKTAGRDRTVIAAAGGRAGLGLAMPARAG
ncbi:GGDEF domain-containing protein [Phaeospirillum tilakii]|uniref:diguanylate cyclase n=1 Tax=Phaeospirillum tilakii TaxID=741673 RepID=A0ABW5CBG2_9PROT